MLTGRKFTNCLLQSIERRDWSDVYRYLNEASVPYKNNAYALHEVCRDAMVPINIVRDIYHAYPKAALANDSDYCTPLYIAVEAEFEDAVAFLVNVCPEAIVCCGSPLRSAIFSLNCTNIIDSIVNADPEATLIPDYGGDSDFDVFFRVWNVFMRIVIQEPTVDNNIMESEIHGSWKVRDVYQKACIFLKAANFHRKDKTPGDSCLLHIAVREESCHWAFCKLIMELHPEQVLKSDIDGNLPIHLLAAAKNLSDEETFLCMDCFTTKSKLISIEYLNGDTAYCCEDCFESEQKELIRRSSYMESVHKVDEMVKDLISFSPRMAFISDGKGNYPMHIAIHNQQSYGIICELFKASPDIVRMQDTKTKLLPFMLAAVGKWKSDIDQTSIIYYLLMKYPVSLL